MVASIDTGHAEPVTHLAVDHVYKQAATCSLDCSINLYDMRNPDSMQKICTLPKGHDGPIFQIAFSHPFSGRYLASCGVDHKVLIWKYNENDANLSEEEKWTCDFSYSLQSSLNGVAFSPFQYGTKLAVVCSEAKILIISRCDQINENSADEWMVNMITESVPMGNLAVCWAPATAVGSIIDCEDRSIKTVQRFATGGIDSFLRIWQLDDNDGRATWKLAFELGEHSEWIRAIAWCPVFIGKHRSQIAVGLHNGQIVVWTFDDVTNTWSLEIIYKGNTFVSNISFSSCGSMLTAAFSNSPSIVMRRNFSMEWKKICSNLDLH